jgi:hypothetical protein
VDSRNFDSLTRAFVATPAGSRRAVVRGVIGSGVAALLIRLGVEEAAALRDNGEACKRGRQCKSGLCKGAKDKKKCRKSPNQGICTIASNVCGGTDTDCGSNCACFVTFKQGLAFCGDVTSIECGCGANNDCAHLPGAVCAKDEGGAPCCGLAGNTTCVFPCVNPD